MIEFEDGTTLSAEDWDRILRVIAERARTGKPRPVKIESGGVTVKLDGLEPRTDGSTRLNKKKPAYANYVESPYKGWTIRVWRYEKEQAYGCNYYCGEDVRYFELRYDDARDENAVFKVAQSLIDQLAA